ncbi:hypothetical protein B188_12630 [Candidatus Brocadiaceae bacterium B188]|nr:hypothetical protein B188_12630 [Candidatus Brocadiaceae bacterium B188]
MVRQTHHARRYILSLPKDQPNDKLVCPCCLKIHTDLEYITLTNDVCQCHPVTRLNKMKISIQLNYDLRRKNHIKSFFAEFFTHPLLGKGLGCGMAASGFFSTPRPTRRMYES